MRVFYNPLMDRLGYGLDLFVAEEIRPLPTLDYTVSITNHEPVGLLIFSEDTDRGDMVSMEYIDKLLETETLIELKDN